MNRLNELIAELCPDGVEYKALCEIFDTRNGYTPSKSKKEYWENGTIPWFRMEDIRTNGPILSDALQYVSKSAVKGTPFPANSIIVATSATIGEHALITVESLANQRFTYLMLKNEYKAAFDIKFLFYYCYKLDAYCLACLNKGNFASVDMAKFSRFRFPIVPLQIQREIVKILDNFTELTKKLQSQLAAEAEARKRQYEYYRDALLSFTDSSQIVQVERGRAVRWLKLREISILFRGSYITKKDTEVGNIPVILGGQEPAYFIDKSNHEGEIVVIARSGVSAGFVSYWNEPIYITDGFGYEAITDIVVPKYLYYILKNREAELNAMKRGAGVPHVSNEALGNVRLPIPDIEEQAHIVAILDRFDTLCNNISVGLPAEIAARQRQYEYYRDKLLEFKELKE